MNNRKTVLITGGGGGIGLEFAKIFYAHGYNLVVVSLLQEELQSLKTHFEAKSDSQKIETIQKDLSELGAALFVFEECKKRGLDIDVLISNAGFGLYGEHVAIPMGDISKMIYLNVIAGTELCTLFGREMKEKGYGHILITSSTTSFQPLPFLAAYAATKAYLTSFAQAFRREMQEYGVVVSYVCPGTTKTHFLKTAGIENNRKPFSFGWLAHKVQGKPETVARVGYKGLFSNKAMTIPGLDNKFHHLLVSFVPNRLTVEVVHRVFKRQ